jgi:hypothetical protein
VLSPADGDKEENKIESAFETKHVVSGDCRVVDDQSPDRERNWQASVVAPNFHDDQVYPGSGEPHSFAI